MEIGDVGQSGKDVGDLLDAVRAGTEIGDMGRRIDPGQKRFGIRDGGIDDDHGPGLGESAMNGRRRIRIRTVIFGCGIWCLGGGLGCFLVGGAGIGVPVGYFGDGRRRGGAVKHDSGFERDHFRRQVVAAVTFARFESRPVCPD